MLFGDGYIYVGTVLGLRDCRSLRVKYFPEGGAANPRRFFLKGWLEVLKRFLKN